MFKSIQILNATKYFSQQVYEIFSIRTQCFKSVICRYLHIFIYSNINTHKSTYIQIHIYIYGEENSFVFHSALAQTRKPPSSLLRRSTNNPILNIYLYTHTFIFPHSQYIHTHVYNRYIHIDIQITLIKQ